jgi:hypothetical protein
MNSTILSGGTNDASPVPRGAAAPLSGINVRTKRLGEGHEAFSAGTMYRQHRNRLTFRGDGRVGSRLGKRVYVLYTPRGSQSKR